MTLQTTIAIFTRAPVPGATKTRLIPRLGAEGAARLHAMLLRRMLDEAMAAEIGPVELWVTDSSDPALRALAQRNGARLVGQGEGDLGARMARAFRPGRPVLVVGSDCPGLDRARLRAAAWALAGHDVVLNPAEDGGYVLIGARERHDRLFADMVWSTDTVADETRARAMAAGLSLASLAPLWDVDNPEDVDRLLAAAPALGIDLSDM